MSFYDEIKKQEPSYRRSFECECGVKIDVEQKTCEEWSEALAKGEIPEGYPTSWLAGFCLDCGTPIIET